MHGRKKEAPKPESDEAKQEKMKKIAKYVKMTSTALSKNRTNTVDEEGFELAGRIIELNPDFSTVWNYRRKGVEHFLTQRGPEAGPEICDKELQLTIKALQKNPKSYYAWHHRLWTVDKGFCDLQKEIALCTSYLNLDARNFHCWDYRGYILKRVSQPDLQAEFDFTTQKINQNFSNYSAWHYRSALFPRIFGTLPEDQLHDKFEQEFELMKQAFFTEPNDQSSWLYHRWLVCQYVGVTSSAVSSSAESKSSPSASSASYSTSTSPSSSVRLVASSPVRRVSVLLRELRMCEELLEVEPNCKWALLTRAWLLSAALSIHSTLSSSSSSSSPLDGPSSSSSSSSSEWRGSASDLATALGLVAPVVESSKSAVSGVFEQLTQLDPMRANHYRHLQQQQQQ